MARHLESGAVGAPRVRRVRMLMQFTFAEKICVVLGTTALAYVIGVAACSPIAPSVEKDKLTKKPPPSGVTTDPSAPQPTPNTVELLYFRDHTNANIMIGKEA